MIYNNVVQKVAGDHLRVILPLAYLPLMAISLLIMMLKVRETKGVDLENVQVD